MNRKRGEGNASTLRPSSFDAHHPPIVTDRENVYNMHCSVIRDDSDGHVFIGLYRNTQAKFNVPYFMPVLELLERAWALWDTERRIVALGYEPALVRRPHSDMEHEMLLDRAYLGLAA